MAVGIIVSKREGVLDEVTEEAYVGTNVCEEIGEAINSVVGV